MGINSILVYAGLIVSQPDTNLGPYANFTLGLLAFLVTIASHFFIDRCLRRTTMIISALVYFTANIVIMTGMLLTEGTMIFVAMIVAILFYGLTYSTISAIYPSEILKNEKPSYTSLTSWPAMLLVMFLPPVVADVVEPTHTPWPVFLFYGAFSLLSVFYIGFCAVESKDKLYHDILKEF